MKKFLSIVLSLVIMLNVFGCISAFAVEETTATSVEETTTPTEETTTPADEETTTPAEEETTTPAEDTTDPSEVTPPEEPQLPDEFTLESVANAIGGVEVKWPRIEGADAYNVYRRAAGEAKPVVLATVEDLSYVDKVVFNGGYYKYSVKPVFDGVEVIESNAILIRYFETPKVTKAVAIPGGVTISWTPVEGVTNYKMYYRTAGSNEWKYYATVGTHTGTSALFRACTNGNYYRFAISAGAGNYFSGYRTDGPVLRYFAVPILRNITQKPYGLHITWDAIGGVTGYNVYRRAAGEKYFTYLKTVKTAYYLDESIPKASTYKYVVKANYNGKLSGYDSKGLVSYFIAAPKLMGIACGSNGIYLKWSVVPGAGGYDIYRKGPNDQGYVYLTNTNGGTNANYRQYKDTKGVIVGQTYTYVIRSHDPYSKKSNMTPDSLTIKFLPTGNMDKATAYNFYCHAASNTFRLAPGYTAKQWQNVKYSTISSSDKNAQKVFQEAFDTLYYPSSNPFVVTTAKGSTEAKSLLKSGGPAFSVVTSATGVKKGNNYVVTMVLKDEYNPDYNTYYMGINSVSYNYFAYKDLFAALKDEDVIYQGSASSLYKGFKVTAEITPDGRIVSATHSCDQVYVKGDMSLDFRYGPILKYNASMGTYLTYSDFKY